MHPRHVDGTCLRCVNSARLRCIDSAHPRGVTRVSMASTARVQGVRLRGVLRVSRVSRVHTILGEGEAKPMQLVCACLQFEFKLSFNWKTSEPISNTKRGQVKYK